MVVVGVVVAVVVEVGVGVVVGVGVEVVVGVVVGVGVEVCMTDLNAEILAANDHRPDMYWDTKINGYVIRASSLYRCTRSLVLAALDFPPAKPPEAIQGRMDESSILEPVLLERVANGDYEWWGTGSGGSATVKLKLLDPNDHKSYRAVGRMIQRPDEKDDTGRGQFRVQIPVTGGAVRGHLDGLGLIYEWPVEPAYVGSKFRHAMIEGKCLGPDMFRTFESKGLDGFPEYKGQFGVYWLGTTMGVDEEAAKTWIGMFAVGEKVYAEHTEKGVGVGVPTLGRVVVQVMVGAPDIGIGDIKSRGREIMNLVDANNLGANGADIDNIFCDKDSYPCPMYEHHTDETRIGLADSKPKPRDANEVDGEDGELLRFTLEKYREHQKAETWAKGQKEKYKADLNRLVKEYQVAGGGVALEVGGERLVATNTREEWGDHEEVRKVKAGSKDYVTVRATKIKGGV